MPKTVYLSGKCTVEGCTRKPVVGKTFLMDLIEHSRIDIRYCEVHRYLLEPIMRVRREAKDAK